MKRTLILCLSVIMVCCFVGCSDTTTFQKNGMSITLPREFQELNQPDFTICYHTPEVKVLVSQETAENITLAEYAQDVRLASAWLSPGPIETVDGLTTMEYTYESVAAQMKLRYFSAMFQDPAGTFWLIQFCCEDDYYKQYRPLFIEWAKTVCFDTE